MLEDRGIEFITVYDRGCLFVFVDHLLEGGDGIGLCFWVFDWVIVCECDVLYYVIGDCCFVGG